MKKSLGVFLFISFFASSANAQSGERYSNALGVRLGSSVPAIKNGITFKHFVGNSAIEAILSFGDGTALCGLYEVHKPLATTSLQWFIGAGGYVGLANSSSVAGVAGIVGLDYKFTQIPLNITLDWKPEINLVSKIGFESSGLGFSARFTF